MKISISLFFGLCCVLLSSGIEVEASNQNIHEYLQAFQSEKQPYRTAYHFQPPQNWLNGMNIYKPYSFLALTFI